MSWPVSWGLDPIICSTSTQRSDWMLEIPRSSMGNHQKFNLLRAQVHRINPHNWLITAFNVEWLDCDVTWSFVYSISRPTVDLTKEHLMMFSRSSAPLFQELSRQNLSEIEFASIKTRLGGHDRRGSLARWFIRMLNFNWKKVNKKRMQIVDKQLFGRSRETFTPAINSRCSERQVAKPSSCKLSWLAQKRVFFSSSMCYS